MTVGSPGSSVMVPLSTSPLEPAIGGVSEGKIYPVVGNYNGE